MLGQPRTTQPGRGKWRVTRGRSEVIWSSPELCVKVRGSFSMLRLGCLGDLLGLEE